MLKSLSGRFLILTVLFVMLTEVAIFVPSVARFRQDYMSIRLERAQLASLSLLADDMITPDLEAELLSNAGVFNVVLRRDSMRQLVLSSDLPSPVVQSFDMREAGPMMLMKDALVRLVTPEDEVIRVIGNPVRDGGELIEVTMPTAPLRMAMIDYGIRIFRLSAVISLIVAAMLFWAVRALMVRPIKSVVSAMQVYSDAPEDARTVIAPSSNIRELREAEDALQALQTELTGQLRQKERLAQLGGAVAKISHDLRNILTAAQLFTDRIETSDDPVVQRLAPKLVGSISRAVSLCETTLAFGRAEEAPPQFTEFALLPVAQDILEAESLASDQADITYDADIAPDLKIRADSEQMHRVLTNLVRNARQAIVATHKPGTVTISAVEDTDHWCLRVSDTGPGLNEKARANLFEPFKGNARKGGSGLGLVIADELMRGHGGGASLERTTEQGTCFALHLPK